MRSIVVTACAAAFGAAAGAVAPGRGDQHAAGDAAPIAIPGALIGTDGENAVCGHTP